MVVHPQHDQCAQGRIARLSEQGWEAPPLLVAFEIVHLAGTPCFDPAVKKIGVGCFADRHELAQVKAKLPGGCTDSVLSGNICFHSSPPAPHPSLGGL